MELRSLEEMLAAGVDDCGLPLDECPGSPDILPWGHGRPSSRTAVQRGIGWDGRPAVVHTAKETARWSGTWTMKGAQ